MLLLKLVLSFGVRHLLSALSCADMLADELEMFLLDFLVKPGKWL